ncbi:MAG: GAF domain-containing protein [Spirochaetaceae bacterium]|nr:MAG: GAF domain-containing protein [Spirochaetaceae bacterium]
MLLAGLLGVGRSGDFSITDIWINSVNVGIMLSLNLIYFVAVRKVKDVRPLVLFQLCIDAVHFTFTIYKTGAVTSPFTFLYFFVIFSGALLVSSRTAFFTAGISSVFYAAIVLLEHYSLIPRQLFFSPMAGMTENLSYVILTVSFTIGSLIAFAGLAGFLTGLIHRRYTQLKKATADLHDRNKVMLLMYKTSEALNHHQNSSEIAEYILDELMSFLKLDRALIYLNENNTQLRLMLVRTKGGHSDSSMDLVIPMNIDAGLTARVALEKKAYNIKDPANSPYINQELAAKIGLNPFAIAPMVLRKHCIGVIGIDRSTAGIDDDEFSILQLFANQAAIAMDSVQHSNI